MNFSQGTRDQIDCKLFGSGMCDSTAFDNFLLTRNHCFQNEAETVGTRGRLIVVCGGGKTGRVSRGESSVVCARASGRESRKSWWKVRGRNDGLDSAEKLLATGPGGDEAISIWKYYA